MATEQAHEPWCTDHQQMSDIDYCMTTTRVADHYIDIVGPDRYEGGSSDMGGVFFYETFFPAEPLTGPELDAAVMQTRLDARDATALADALTDAAEQWRKSCTGAGR